MASSTQSFSIPYLETNVLQSLQKQSQFFTSLPSNIYIGTNAQYTYKITGYLQNGTTSTMNYYGCILDANKFNVTTNSACADPSYTCKRIKIFKYNLKIFLY
jgi:hypothetical protein